MRRILDRAVSAVAVLAGFATCALVLGVVATILQRGLPSLSWSFLSGSAGDLIGTGGVVYELFGTLLLAATALLVSAPLALGIALALTVYLGKISGSVLRQGLYILNAVPSILFGIFGLIVFVKMFGWGKSWLAGGLLLALMILPTLSVALVERIEALPGRYVRAAAGLGLSREQIVWSVILPQSWTGLLSGSLLGLGRAAGETAPIMFTAAVFAGVTVPQGVRESPVLALPYHIFVLAQDTLDPAVGPHLWAAAFLLLSIAIGASLLSIPVRLRTTEEASHG